MTADLRAWAAWLTAAGCQLAAMESTGSYWMPAWNVLEGQVALLLADAKQVLALSGEKTDRKDGRRLADLVRHGLVRASFVPPSDVRELRDTEEAGPSIRAERAGTERHTRGCIL